MSYQQSLVLMCPISRKKLDAVVFGDSAETHDGFEFDARVNLSMASAGITMSVRMRPSDARALAERLALAAEVAEHGDAEIIPFTLDRADKPRTV